MDFEECCDFILKLEGGLADDPSDPGGITKYGISLKAYKDLGRDGIKNLTITQAKEIYKRDYWNRGKCSSLPLKIRLCYFDACVNMGVKRATIILQEVLNIQADGIFGPQTTKAIKDVREEVFLVDFLSERGLFYSHSPKFGEFGRGWLRRLFIVAQKSGLAFA
jgi:lysozyme family protein